MVTSKDPRNQPSRDPRLDADAHVGEPVPPPATRTDPQQPLIDRLITCFAVNGNDDPTRELGADLVSEWRGIVRSNGDGLLLRRDDRALDPEQNTAALGLLEGHVSGARLEELEHGEDLTDEELQIWRPLAAEEFFNNIEDGRTAWEIAQIVSSGGDEAFVAHLWDGEESSFLGVYGAMPEALDALKGLGYLCLEDFLQRYPEGPAGGNTPVSQASLEHEREALEALGYRDELGHFRICGKCHELCESGRPDGRNQRCRCTPGHEPTWPRFDFNERARLCSCCARVVLASGSRWSPYFCDTCWGWAEGATLWQGRLVMPIGRHSLMHTWVPDMPSGRLGAYDGAVEGMAEAFADALPAFFQASDRLHDWYPVVMADNLRRLGFAGDTSLHEYMKAIVRRDAVLPARSTTFGALCRFMRTRK